MAEENYEGSYRGNDIYSHRGEDGTIYRASLMIGTFRTYDEVKNAIDKADGWGIYVLSTELSQHLHNLGLETTIMDLREDSNPIACVRVKGRSIDRVEISEQWRGTGKKRIKIYIYSYVVETDINGLELELDVQMEPIIKGSPEKIIDFNWVNPQSTVDNFGVGVLTRLLNADTDLKTELLSLELVPNIGIFVRTDDRNVDINYGSGQTMRAFPSKEAFDVYERIAIYIRSITNEKPS